MMLSPELSPHVTTKGSGVYRLSWSSVYSTAFQWWSVVAVLLEIQYQAKEVNSCDCELAV